MATARSFSDINTHWAKAAILALADRQIVNGFPDGTFRPDAFLTRAEYAALMSAAFASAPVVRPAVDFPDVPSTYWAYASVKWGYERGFFTGYPEGNFNPNLPLPRMQAWAVIATALHLATPPQPNDILKLYFDDAGSIPNWVQWAIAAAVLNNCIVNYPDVRQFRPTANTTRAEVAALLCLALSIPNSVPPAYTTWNIGIYEIKGTITVPFERWKGCARLMRDIQVLLTGFRLYPSHKIDGRYNWETEVGLKKFCDFYGLNTMQTGILGATFAQALTTADPVEFILAQAKDRQQIYNTFLAQEVGYSADKLAFLDRGIEASPYKADIAQLPDRLKQKPDGVNIASPGATAIQTGTNATITYDLYPARGEKPPIDGNGLSFLHPDIKQACVCVGSFVDGMIRGHWLGKNALQRDQLWSTTKILPLLNVLCRANAKNPSALIKDCLIRPAGSQDGVGFYDLAIDLVSYKSAIATSNSVSAMFKQFETPAGLEAWVKGITGNSNLVFQGRYGEAPFIQNPELWSQTLKTVLLTPPYSNHNGSNLMSTYDLTRFISLVGWHNHLFPGAQLPGAQWSSLETGVRALGQDTARYIDVAIDQLGLAPVIAEPVILSKLGFGRSDSRARTELVYVAFVQFYDTRPRLKGNPAILRTVSLALLGANGNGDANEEARQIDARMAAEVTEILRRVVTQELV
jgi:hypothetical protein